MDQNQSGFQKFPKGFLFGAATSAHQIEGGNFNSDWYAWEKEGNHIANNDTSEVAADSWNKWREDIELLKKTNQNAYRFSIEWAKIEPEEGKFDQTAIEHYRDILTELKKNNITPLVGLHHFTNPQWLDKIGGFTNKKSIKFFMRYATKAIDELGDLSNLWATFNEPKVYILKGNVEAEWYPGKRNLVKAYKIYKNINRAHKETYCAIKKLGNYQVGIVQNISAYIPKRSSFLNNMFVRIAKYFDTTIFIKPIVKYIDFLGINYYMKFELQAKKPFISRPGTLKNDYGWNINQEGIYQIITENTKWNKPIYLTENGIADAEDKYRAQFITEALNNIAKSIKNGADVKGYFYWSLLDNFEWAAGYTMKFGLADINRKLRPSAEVYKHLIQKYSADSK